jgi:hypothetical protein
MKFQNISLVVMALAVMFAVSGCETKNLTPSSAKSLLQTKYQADDRFMGAIPYAPFRMLVNGRYPTDYRPDQYQRNTQAPAGSRVAKFVALGENALHQLVKSGLVKEVPVENSMYQYSPTQDFLRFVINGPQGEMLKLGQVRVDNVNNLLLGDSENYAEGQYTWHVDYNDVGRAVMGDIKKQGTGRVSFRKQPDGAWVCSSYEVTSETDQ